jgi:hypothetical protein
MGFVVYTLCAITCLACAVLLLRGFARSRARLLLWSGLCFVGLFVNNALLVVGDRLAYDLTLVRTYPALVGIALLVYGLVWESER